MALVNRVIISFNTEKRDRDCGNTAWKQRDP